VVASSRFGEDLRIRIRGARCVYCGETAQTDEHFPPACVSPYGYVLPACRECNRFAGTEFSYDFEQRCLSVKRKIRKKYIKQLETPDWSNDEVAEIGYNLRRMVTKWQRLKPIIQQRLAWSVPAYLGLIDHRSVFVPVDANSNFTTMSEKELLSTCEKVAKSLNENKEATGKAALIPRVA